jgi:hypothetical protein
MSDVPISAILALAATAVMFAAVPTSAGELTKEDATEALAPQYLYMVLCEDFPPLPLERLLTINALLETVDKEEVKKAAIRWGVKLKLQDPAKLTAFCSRMANTIKNEPGHEEWKELFGK